MNDFGPVEILVGLIKSMNGTPNGSNKKRNKLSMNQTPLGCSLYLHLTS